MPVSQAFAGVGAKLWVSDETSSGGSWTRIAEITGIDGPGIARDTIEVTNLDSDGGYAEFIASFRDGGELNCDANFTHEGFEELKADFEVETKRYYKIELPNTDKSTFMFLGLVTGLGVATPLKDKVSLRLTIKISGQVIYYQRVADEQG